MARTVKIKFTKQNNNMSSNNSMEPVWQKKGCAKPNTKAIYNLCQKSLANTIYVKFWDETFLKLWLTGTFDIHTDDDGFISIDALQPLSFVLLMKLYCEFHCIYNFPIRRFLSIGIVYWREHTWAEIKSMGLMELTSLNLKCSHKARDGGMREFTEDEVHSYFVLKMYNQVQDMELDEEPVKTIFHTEEDAIEIFKKQMKVCQRKIGFDKRKKNFETKFKPHECLPKVDEDE
jgi:hypothetical protein